MTAAASAGAPALGGLDVESVWIEAPGARLHAWHVRPQGPPPWPTVAMAHGWGAVKELGLDHFAAALAAAGLAALVFDHRGFGASEGPRGDADPRQQIADYGAVLDHAAALESADPERLAVWGTSYSGGHVLCVAAADRRVRAAVAQVPTISGSENLRRRLDAAARAELHGRIEAERRALAAGEEPSFSAAVGAAEFPVAPAASEIPPDPASLPPLSTEEFGNATTRFYETAGPLRRTTWANRVTVSSWQRYSRYEPGRQMAAVAPTPLLVIAAAGDAITPTDLIREAHAGAGGSARLLELPGGHYDVYGSARPRAAAAAAEFLAEQLGAS